MATHGYGCHGLYEFAFSSVHADPYYALDSREDDLCAAFTSPPLDIAHSGAASPLVLLLNTVQTEARRGKPVKVAVRRFSPGCVMAVHTQVPGVCAPERAEVAS